MIDPRTGYDLPTQSDEGVLSKVIVALEKSMSREMVYLVINDILNAGISFRESTDVIKGEIIED